MKNKQLSLLLTIVYMCFIVGCSKDTTSGPKTINSIEILDYNCSGYLRETSDKQDVIMITVTINNNYIRTLTGVYYTAKVYDELYNIIGTTIMEESYPIDIYKSRFKSATLKRRLKSVTP